jgi:hypothetical protein
VLIFVVYIAGKIIRNVSTAQASEVIEAAGAGNLSWNGVTYRYVLLTGRRSRRTSSGRNSRVVAEQLRGYDSVRRRQQSRRQRES